MKIKDLTLPLKGQCHCGSVTYEINSAITGLRRCNCSICRRKGFVMGTALAKEIKIMSGSEFLNTYKWNTNEAEHYFCKLCGTNTHHKRRSPRNEYGYNIGCIEGFDMEWIKDIPFVDNIKMSVVSTNKKNAAIEK